MVVIETNMIPDGLASAPGLALSSEPATGLFKRAGGQLGIAIAGSEVGYFDADGFAGGVRVSELTFVETSGDGVYTGTIELPAGARMLDIGVDAQALWTAGTSASIVVGDDSSANGFFTATDLKATDLLAGEINNIEHPGGKAGSYIASEQRKLYSASARNVIAVLTKVGTGTAGRTRVYVVWAMPSTTSVDKV